MEYLRDGYRLAALFLIALFCAASPLDAQPASREQPRFGGVLKVATATEPPSLDPHWSTAGITDQIMRHVFSRRGKTLAGERPLLDGAPLGILGCKYLKT